MNEPRNVLALDTSTDACVVAVKGGDRIEERLETLPRQHNRLLLPMVTGLLQEMAIGVRDLDLIVFGCGPGSFTGIRIATGVVQGLAFGLGIPVAPVSTLASLAQGRYARTGDQCMAVAMQARGEEIYFGCYEVLDGVASAAVPDSLVAVSDVSLPTREEWVGIGDGWRHRTSLELALDGHISAVEESVHPRGRDLITLGLHSFARGDCVSAAEAAPVYLREKVAATIADRSS